MCGITHLEGSPKEAYERDLYISKETYERDLYVWRAPQKSPTPK